MNPELETEAAGFNDDDDDTSISATETPREDDDEPRQAAAEAAAEQVIEYAQLTKTEWEEVKARAARIDEIRATQDKSFGTIGNTIRGLQDQLKAAQAGANVEILQEDIDALKEDFPPLAAALEKVRSMRAIPVGFDPAKVEELVGPRLKAAEQKFEMRLLARDHPDWQQVDASPEFQGYVKSLPEAERKQLADASENFDSDVVSRFITRFKATKPAGTTRKSRFDAAVTPRGSGVTHNAVGSDEKSGFDSA